MAGKARGQATFCAGDARRTAVRVSILGILPGSGDSALQANAAVDGTFLKRQRHSLEPRIWQGKTRGRATFHTGDARRTAACVSIPGILSTAAILHRRQTPSMGCCANSSVRSSELQTGQGKTRGQAIFCSGDARRTPRVSPSQGFFPQRRFCIAGKRRRWGVAQMATVFS